MLLVLVLNGVRRCRLVPKNGRLMVVDGAARWYREGSGYGKPVLGDKDNILGFPF